MTVTVRNLYSGSVVKFEGDEAAVRAKLQAQYPWLTRYKHPTLKEDIDRLGSAQAFDLEVTQ